MRHLNPHPSSDTKTPDRALRTTVARKDRKKPKPKKDAQLVLRLESALRDDFVDACEDLDTSAAREVRRFIKGFLKRYRNGDFDDLH